MIRCSSHVLKAVATSVAALQRCGLSSSAFAGPWAPGATAPCSASCSLHGWSLHIVQVPGPEDPQRCLPAGSWSNLRQPYSVATGLSWRRQYAASPSQQQATPSQEQQRDPENDGRRGAAADSLTSLPNLVSLARLASGPVISHWIWQGHWGPAVTLLAAAGASDWLDGYLARRQGLQSALGSYLDPLADKVLICSVVATLGAQGTLPAWVVAVIVGRDAALVAGMFWYRFKTFGFKWPGRRQFFSTADQPAVAGQVPGVPYMKPLMISKINTVVQIALVLSCVLHEWQGWPDQQVLWGLEAAAAGATAASGVLYGYRYATGRLLPKQ